MELGLNGLVLDISSLDGAPISASPVEEYAAEE